MKTSVSKVITNHEADSPFNEVDVVFKDDINSPHNNTYFPYVSLSHSYFFLDN